MENRDNGSTDYYEIFTNDTIFNYVRRITWGYLPYFSFNKEDELGVEIYIDWRK